MRLHDLRRLAVGLGAKHRAQRLVPRHQRRKARAQGRLVQLTPQPKRASDVIRAALGLQLPQEPLAALGIRQRQRIRFARWIERGDDRALGCMSRQRSGQRAKSLVLEHLLH